MLTNGCGLVGRTAAPVFAGRGACLVVADVSRKDSAAFSPGFGGRAVGMICDVYPVDEVRGLREEIITRFTASGTITRNRLNYGSAR